MKCKLLTSLLLTAMFVALDPTAVASTTWYVNGMSGSDSNNCLYPTTACKTIGHAISLASRSDSIMVAAATYTENLTIPFSLKVIGASAATTIIDGGRAGTVVTIPNYGPVILSEVTIRNGQASFGAGIYNNGLLTINNSRVSGNLAFVAGRSFSYGGGIYNNTKGMLTINNSTLSGNSAGCGSIGCAGLGGGIYNIGGLLINNSTLSGNSAYAHYAYSQGGGISNGGTQTISNTTISGNSAAHGGGIFGSATLQNSIVANSPSGGNCNGTMTSHGYNLSSDGTCNFNAPGDINNTDPQLGPLQNNGGPTQTMALPSGSPAVDAGNPTGCTDNLGHLLKTDQRGMPRPDTEDRAGCDMGAYERQSD